MTSVIPKRRIMIQAASSSVKYWSHMDLLQYNIESSGMIIMRFREYYKKSPVSIPFTQFCLMEGQALPGVTQPMKP